MAACYQLLQSVLKIGSVLTERVGQGEVGGCTPLGDNPWRMLQLAVLRKALGGPFVCFLVQTGAENAPLTLHGPQFLAVFSSEECSLVGGP